METEVPLSREESSPFPLQWQSATTLVQNRLRQSEIGICELSSDPGVCIIMDRIDKELSADRMQFKAWLLHGDNKRITDELHQRFSNGQWQNHMAAKICTDRNKPLTLFPSIRLGNRIKLTLDTNNNIENQSNRAFMSTDARTMEFMKENIKRPSEILKRMREEDWPTENLPSIPSFPFTIFIQNPFKCQATFKLRIQPDNDQETVLEYVAFVDNQHTQADALQSVINHSRDKLHIYHRFIISDMEDVDFVITKLAEAEVLNDQERDNLCRKQNDKNDDSWRIGELIRYLMERHNGFLSLINALQETGLEKNMQLADKLR